ncbi:unnamed protein product [Lepidochelys kempii]
MRDAWIMESTSSRRPTPQTSKFPPPAQTLATIRPLCPPARSRPQSPAGVRAGGRAAASADERSMLSAPYVARSYAERHPAGHRLGGRPQPALSRPEGAALAAARSSSRLPRRLPSAKQGSERNVLARSSAGVSSPQRAPGGAERGPGLSGPSG